MLQSSGCPGIRLSGLNLDEPRDTDLPEPLASPVWSREKGTSLAGLEGHLIFKTPSSLGFGVPAHSRFPPTSLAVPLLSSLLTSSQHSSERDHWGSGPSDTTYSQATLSVWFDSAQY